jgi:hypothetical protein
MSSEPNGGDGEGQTESFVVRLWLEDARRTSRAQWRGRITHVDGNERRYIRQLDDIPRFIVPFLEELGGDIGWRWRAKRWLRR